jgi:hypothetical protein
MNIDQLYEQVSNRSEEVTSEKNRMDALVKEVSGIRNNITFLESEIANLLKDTEYDPEYPELLNTIKSEFISLVLRLEK